jgi:hypothetical protein
MIGITGIGMKRGVEWNRSPIEVSGGVEIIGKKRMKKIRYHCNQEEKMSPMG